MTAWLALLVGGCAPPDQTPGPGTPVPTSDPTPYACTDDQCIWDDVDSCVERQQTCILPDLRWTKCGWIVWSDDYGSERLEVPPNADCSSWDRTMAALDWSLDGTHMSGPRRDRVFGAGECVHPTLGRHRYLVSGSFEDHIETWYAFDTGEWVGTWWNHGGTTAMCCLGDYALAGVFGVDLRDCDWDVAYDVPDPYDW